MSQNVSDELIKFCSEIGDGVRQRHHEIVDDRVLEEKIKGIENASLALYEAKVEDD